MKPTSLKSTSVLIELLIIVIGSFITAFGLNKLIIPAGILSGGLTGISQFIDHFIPINVGVFYFILNIPLLIIGYLHLGKKFSIYTIISTLVLSLFLFVIPIEHIWTDSILLSAIFGGVISSFGCGLVLRCGGSQGGMDILSRVIAKYHNITVGKSNMIINGCIVLLSSLIFGTEIAMYTIIYMYTAMKTYDIILNHVDRISLLIVTEKGDKVCDAITHEMHRGTTTWKASGGYTHGEKTVLYCVITKSEMNQLKKIVKTVDPCSFVSIISTQNVIGKFHQVW